MKFTVGEINIVCTNVEASLKFYRDILGFVPTQDEDGFYHLLSDGRQYLLLPIANTAFPEGSYGSIAQISMDLYVENLEQAYRYFQEHEVEFAIEWQTGARMFVIRDPDGLHWEIVA